mmetsp:Transcript_13862/g.18166  ORF Transcript_13862/g.18166 Transcript_13862/m.18166 type:complete len:198 (+) Transcript_13862:176-769(+)|eukprot:CAMPEP_0116064338 /NCGR_PEP_ID=MMETSP0322-20121206/9032_1 /TAXON_ID=163516 /ORGANISM="Leptocylindrus danicus var. apora, Strain B651" /LENGTH=197 /DNA_ID=CAMNT_0003550291 /DNA_START=91 /DNA_END=684 /DNA_ORIENTATION=-
MTRVESMSISLWVIMAITLQISEAFTFTCSSHKSIQSFRNTALGAHASRRDVLTGLLASSSSAAAVLLSSNAALAAPRPEYLTEPTDDFKESEKQRMEFKAAQLKIKKEFTDVLERFTNVSKNEDEIVKDLKDLRRLVVETGGMPLGIKKEDMVKIIRRKKALGFWPTNCEIAYQDLFREILFQQSPNKEKDPLSSM